MTKLAFLLGLFAVPLALLFAGHSFRRRSARGRTVFWGAVVGYFAGVLLATTLALVPAVQWLDHAPRGVAVQWGMLLGALLGTAAGWTLALRRGR